MDSALTEIPCTGCFRFIVKMYHYTTLVICIRFELNKIILKANTGTFDIMFSADLFVVKYKIILSIFSELIFITMAPPSQLYRAQEIWIVEHYAKLSTSDLCECSGVLGSNKEWSESSGVLSLAYWSTIQISCSLQKWNSDEN